MLTCLSKGMMQREKPMARINKVRFVGWVVLSLAVLWLGGCASYIQAENAKSAFHEAEQLAAEERFDLAVEKYMEAAELEPSSKTYKLKMISTRTRAAAQHVKQARLLRNAGKLSEALGRVSTCA